MRKFNILIHFGIVLIFTIMGCDNKPECGNSENEIIPVDLPEFPSLETAEAQASGGCQIVFSEEGKLFIDIDEVPIEGICLALKEGNCFSKPVIVRAKRKTNYDFYIKVYKTVQSCYLQRLDVLAFAQYSKNYHELNVQEKKQVDSICFLDIIEVKPE